MQGDKLVADEVVARGKGCGDGAGPLLVATDKLGDLPAGWVLAVEEDLLAVTLEASLRCVRPGILGVLGRFQIRTSSILNQPAPEPSQELKAPGHL